VSARGDELVPYQKGALAIRDHRGAGPAVMLLHGLGGNVAHWARLAPLLGDRYRLVAIDLPSHGRSTAPDAYSFDYDVGAVDHVRQHLGLDRPAVVGHSYGGMLAVVLGERRPIDYRSIVNIDVLGFGMSDQSDSQVAADELSEADLVTEGDSEWLAIQLKGDVEEAESMGLHLDGADEALRRCYPLGGDGLWHRSPTIQRFVEIDEAIAAMDLLPAYARTACPTVTVVAERRDAPTDAIADVHRKHTENLVAALRDTPAVLDVVPTGHYPHLEAPEETAARFGTWVEGPRGQAN
jgi:pimeloyl-ACP methyl ester carboxylesterase